MVVPLTVPEPEKFRAAVPTVMVTVLPLTVPMTGCELVLPTSGGKNDCVIVQVKVPVTSFPDCVSNSCNEFSSRPHGVDPCGSKLVNVPLQVPVTLVVGVG